jgi:hypothetical protein
MAPVGGRPDLGLSRRHLLPFLNAKIHALSFAVVPLLTRQARPLRWRKVELAQ